MNAITPAKEMPPDHRTAARGTLPIEQTKLSTAITGPAITFSIVRTSGGASVTKSALKKSSPSRAMNPARKKPIVISFQSICQSPRKLCATSDHAAAERSFWRRAPALSALWCTCPASACCACSRASRSSRGETKRRSSNTMSTMSTIPPTNSASVNCQPSSSHSTSPSSHTRFVDANWKARADAADAPRAKSERAIAIAA